MKFNPFDKNPTEPLSESDLQGLIENKVAEGYFVEYKSDFPKKEKISHSIASLANTYGGWYFIGVAADKENNTATSLTGFSLQEHHDPIAEIRNIARDYISPTPIFFTHVVKLGSADRVVLAIYIPDDQETPFICKDGRLYRRVSDSSDPIMENDRHSLDKLVYKGKNPSKKFQEFCQDERTFCQEEENLSWLQIFISPHPNGLIEKTNIYSKSTIKDLINQSKRIPLSASWMAKSEIVELPLNSGQITHRSIILVIIYFTHLRIALEFFGE
jgi:predicted HTH transcriptional regulator